jgi:prepilin-type N-terminal cleavage/methylation domain-containing protein
MERLRGFTLLEVLIVVAVLAILSAISTPIFRGFLKKNELDSVTQGIVYDLKRARANAMSGENGLKWGIRFNSATNSYYYQVFSSPGLFSNASTSIESTIYLPKQIIFSEPAGSSTKDIIFERISGSVSASSSVTIFNSADNMTKTVNVNMSGNVY